jgi:hypothetical protein
VGWRIAGWLLIQGRVTNLPVDLLAAVSSSGLCKVEISLSMNEAGMGKSRFETFSDSVVAIIITIMVLELKVPHGGRIEALAPRMPRSRISDVLSAHPVGLRASICCMDWHSDRTIVVQGQT